MKTAIITATGPYNGGMSDQQFVRAVESFIERRSGWEVTVTVNAAPTTEEMREKALQALLSDGIYTSEIAEEMIAEKIGELFGEVPGQPLMSPQTDKNRGGPNGTRHGSIVWDRV